MPVNTRFFAFLASALIPAASPALASPIATETPRPLPAITYLDAQGKAQTLKTNGARLTIVHFWATWCIPCVKELPSLDKAYGRWKQEGVIVVPIALAVADKNAAEQFFKDHHIRNLPLDTDRNNQAMEAAHLQSLPTTLFVNAGGEEIARVEGAMDWQGKEMEDFVKQRLSVAKPVTSAALP